MESFPTLEKGRIDSLWNNIQFFPTFKDSFSLCLILFFDTLMVEHYDTVRQSFPNLFSRIHERVAAVMFPQIEGG